MQAAQQARHKVIGNQVPVLTANLYPQCCRNCIKLCRIAEFIYTPQVYFMHRQVRNNIWILSFRECGIHSISILLSIQTVIYATVPQGINYLHILLPNLSIGS